MASRRSGGLLQRIGALVRGDRAAAPPPPPPPPVTTQSSPGQIANLQEKHGGRMAPPTPETSGD